MLFSTRNLKTFKQTIAVVFLPILINFEIKNPNSFEFGLQILFIIFYLFLFCSLANKVFFNSIAMVMGPTPPGTGVMNEAFLDTFS